MNTHKYKATVRVDSFFYKHTHTHKFKVDEKFIELIKSIAKLKMYQKSFDF